MDAGEPLGCHADDGEFDGVQADGTTDDIGSPPEITLPHPVADDGHRAAAGRLVVGGSESASEGWPDPEG